MPYFAKLDDNNVVICVLPGREEDEGQEEALSARTGDTYKQTSYNTRGGVHFGPDGNPSSTQAKAKRKNYAGIGYTYDPVKDIFIPPKPYESWTLHESSGQWRAPKAMPPGKLDKKVRWDEKTQGWLEAPLTE